MVSAVDVEAAPKESRKKRRRRRSEVESESESAAPVEQPKSSDEWDPFA
jgi:hypothetical protein